MTEQKKLISAFNKSAPAYEPELWNNRITHGEMQDFIKSHEKILTKILAQTRNETVQQAKAHLNGEQAEFRLDDALIAFNKGVENGLSDAAISKKFGIDEGSVAEFRKPAYEFYLKQGFQKYANCYTYAMNDPDRYNYLGDEPGDRAYSTDSSGKTAAKRFALGLEFESHKDYAGYKKMLLEDVVADGAIMGGKEAEPMEGHYRVAVYTMPPEKMGGGDNGWTDMHFVRENGDGTWSHKSGSGPVTDKDKDGKTITDPKTANLGGYEFVSYVYVPEGGLDVGQGWEPQSKKSSVNVPLNPQENWKRQNAAPFPEMKL